jgi:hypothetical protein
MKSALSYLPLTVALATCTAACADDDSSMYVEGVLAMQPPACDLKADPSAPQLLRGTLDVAFLQSYQGAVLVANQLTPRGVKKQLRTETQGVELEGAEVTISNAQGDVLDEFSTPTGGFVHSNTSETPGYGLALVTLIPPQLGDSIGGQLGKNRGASRTVIAGIRVYGTTLGGTEITSGQFTFPIDVCYGCLVDFPLDAVMDTGMTRICQGGTDKITTAQCIRGQDAIIDCRECAATLDVCAFLD